MVLHVDYLNEQSILGFADSPDKVEANLKLLPDFAKGIEQQRPRATMAFVVINTVGRWLIVYREQVRNPVKKMMYFIDFRYEVDEVIKGIFSGPLAESILARRSEFDESYQKATDTVELTLAEPYEIEISRDIVACNVDEQVIRKADALGVLPILQAPQSDSSVKACFADEMEGEGDSTTKNVYAFLRFGESDKSNSNDNGYAYLKLRDLNSNIMQLDSFLDKVLSSGVRFDRAAIFQRFTKDRLN